MKQIVLALAVAGIFVAGAAHAQSGADVVKAKGCLNCHELDKKKVGPAFKDVAAKYKGNKDAEATLTKGLRAGAKDGKGHPVKVTVSDAELKAALNYVLSLK